jgi:cystathionine beta-lyase
MLSPGDEVLATDALYGPSRRFLERWMSRYGVKTRYHRADADADEVLSMLGDRTRLVLIESPASLTFEMLDVAGLCRGARERGIITVMDNTWAAGLAFKPLQQGVDISVQALTKYVSGHSDVLMGSICVSDPEIGHKIGHTIEDMGWHVSPDDAWLALRGVRTLTLRYQEQARSGLLVAQWLSQRPEISRILYPALPSDPGHRLWLRDYSGSASVMGLIMKGGNEASAHAFLDALSLFGLGWSWGGYESLATHDTGQLSYRAQALDLPGELIRLHIGLEDPKDLIADLEVGLAAWVQQLG